MKRLLIVFEGEGETKAAPLLARRVMHELLGLHGWQFETQRRRDIAHLSANGWKKFRRYLQAAFNENAPILWMLDCDDGCAIDWIKQLYAQIDIANLRQPLAFCFWVREYECMFLYDFENTKAKLRIAKSKNTLENPEQCRDVKEWLSAQMPSGSAYKETVNQEALSATIDIEKLRNNYGCFRHFEKALLWLTTQDKAGLYPLTEKG